jgi:hypothetical protein
LASDAKYDTITRFQQTEKADGQFRAWWRDIGLASPKDYDYDSGISDE